jgi:hypothetical protein
LEWNNGEDEEEEEEEEVARMEIWMEVNNRKAKDCSPLAPPLPFAAPSQKWAVVGGAGGGEKGNGYRRMGRKGDCCCRCCGRRLFELLSLLFLRVCPRRLSTSY